MLLTIHNLPSSTRYIDVKALLQEKCGLTELILDNLVSEGAAKRVTVGVADEGDAGILVRKVNGLYVDGRQLYVEDKRKKKDSDQPYRSSASLAQDTRYPEFHAAHSAVDDAMAASVNSAMMMNYNMAGMYVPMPVMPIDQNMSYMGYGGGFMAMPSVEPRLPAPARSDRGLAGFQGEDGSPGGRPREQTRDAARSRDRARRPSPNRSAEASNRPSRWNEPKQADVPPRREATPPRKPWASREPTRAPRPPAQPERAAPRDRNFEQFPSGPQPPEPRRADPTWGPHPSRWDDDRNPPQSEPQWGSEPAPEPYWEPRPDSGWQPEPDREWQPESNRGRQPKSDREWQPESNRGRPPKPDRERQPELKRERQPKPGREWQLESNRGRQPNPDQEWQPEPKRGRQPEPNRGRQPKPDQEWQPEPNRGRQQEPNRGRQPKPDQIWQPEPKRGRQPESKRGRQPHLDQGWQPEPDQGWQPEPDHRWQPEPEQAWQPEPNRNRLLEPNRGRLLEPNRERLLEPNQGRQPEPNRRWQPEPILAGDEPYHVMENADDRRFNNWEDGFQPGPAGEYPGPEQFEPNDRRFGEGYPPVHHNEPDFCGQGPNLPDARNRRPRDAGWNAGNERWDENRAANRSSRDEPPWGQRDDQPRLAHSTRNQQTNREPKSLNFNSRNGSEWREDKRTNPPKRGLPDGQRGPQDWNQIASDYPPFKKPRVDFDKRAVEPRRNNFAPKENENQRRMPTQRPPERPQRTPQTLSTLMDRNQKPNTVTHIINKDQTSRGQATAKLAKEANFVHGKLRDLPQLVTGVLKELKQCIRSRIDVLLGEELLTNYEEIIKRYRSKYPVRNDRGLYQCMKDKVTQRLAMEQKENELDGNMAAVKTEKSESQMKVEPGDNKTNKSVKTAGNRDEKRPKARPAKHGTTVKQVIREEKLQRKLEYSSEDHYQLEPVTDKVVNEELEKFTEIFASECQDPVDETEKVICNRITKQSVDEFKQVTRLHLAKRILNIRSGLTIRIFSVVGKLPKRAAVQEYLKPYMIAGLDLKKNKKGTMYVANIASFKHYDQLCKLGNDTIDGISVSIKSMYLVGPSPKLTSRDIKMRRQQLINSQIEPRGSLLVPAENQNESTESQIEPTESQIEPTESQIQLTESQTEPTKSQIESTENQVELTTQSIKIEQAKDPMNNLNAESMEDFAADEFDGEDFTANACDGEDFGADDFTAEPSAENPNVGDPEELNIADIKEEDLEDF